MKHNAPRVLYIFNFLFIFLLKI